MFPKKNQALEDIGSLSASSNLISKYMLLSTNREAQIKIIQVQQDKKRKLVKGVTNKTNDKTDTKKNRQMTNKSIKYMKIAHLYNGDRHCRARNNYCYQK